MGAVRLCLAMSLAPAAAPLQPAKLKKLGFIKETVDVSKYSDPSLVEAAANRPRWQA